MKLFNSIIVSYDVILFIILFKVVLDAVPVHSTERYRAGFLWQCLRCQFFLRGILQNILFRHFRTHGA